MFANITRSVTILCGLALLGATLAPSVKADAWDKKTVITINEAVQMPTVLLQPGKYVFKLLDSLSDRHIVQVFQVVEGDPDESHIVATILAIPNYRLKPTGKSDFQFWEMPAGQQAAMRAWFYPGDNFGQEFAYPKRVAVKIASVVKAPVPMIVVDNDADLNAVPALKTVPLEIVDETGKETPVVVAQAPRPAPAAAMEVAKSDTVAAPATLPQAGSLFPLIGLMGLGSLGIAGVMSGFSKRS